MKLTFLGTGTSQGVPVIACPCDVCSSPDHRDKRLRSSFLVEIDGLTIVIDAGPDFRQQMLGACVTNLSAILLTHEHYDHLAGLDDIRAFNWVQKKPTDIYAEERVNQSVREVFSYVFASKKYPGIPQMILHPIDEEPFMIGYVHVVPIRGLHYRLPVLGFRIGKMAYLTDFNSLPNTELEKLKDLDVLIINALRREPHVSHFTMDEALSVISEVKPVHAYLTHISHQMGRYSDVEKLLPDNVFLAYDGLSLVL